MTDNRNQKFAGIYGSDDTIKLMFRMRFSTSHMKIDVKRVCLKHELPSIGIVSTNSAGELTTLEVSGIRKFGSDEQVTIDDLYHIGSCTKSMTATLAAILVDEGKIAWETTIHDIFVDKQIHPSLSGITLEHLLSHRSGIIGDLKASPIWSTTWKKTLAEERASEVRDYFVMETLKCASLFPPGEGYLYSNAGYTVAGAMIERVTNQTWEENLTSRIFEPLSMQSAGFGPPAANDSYQPWGHRQTEKGIVAVMPDLRGDNPMAIGPSGSVHCNLKDMAKYLAFHLKANGNSGLPITEQTRKHIHAPWPKSDYGYGWSFHKRPWAGGMAMYHNGSNTMFFAAMWIAPAVDFAVFAATNCGGELAAKACDEIITERIKKMKAPGLFDYFLRPFTHNDA